jgi:DNA polymerase/3'-5' exonuclease PolX
MQEAPIPEITADNAMSLSKGKTKIPNIGKASAEKMKEYMETGTIQKLEEKRADNA